MTAFDRGDIFCTRIGAPRFLQWCDIAEVRKHRPWNDPDVMTDWIEVAPDIFVEIENRSVCEHDWDGDIYRPLTAADVKKYGLEDEFYPYDYDEETGELITEWRNDRQ